MALESPRFRNDLQARPLVAEGIQYVEALDPRSGSSFRFYDFEHAVAEVLDGRPLDAVLPQARERTGLELSVDQLVSFAERLAELGFLEEASPAPSVAPSPRPREDAGTQKEETDEETDASSFESSSAPATIHAPSSLAEPEAESERAPERPLTDGDVAATPPPFAPSEVHHTPPPAPPPAPEPPLSPPPALAAPVSVSPLAPSPEAPSAETPTREVPAAIQAEVAPRRRRPRTPLIYAALGVAAAVAVGLIVFRMATPSEPAPVSVRTVAPPVVSVYRWVEATATVKKGGGRVLTFPGAGTVVSILGPGSAFQPGDLVAELDTARRAKGELARHRERLAYYQQMLETMRTANNRPEIRQAELKIAEKSRLVAEAEAELAKTALVATEAGEVAEAVATVGTPVKAGAEAVRLKGQGWRAEFELPPDEASQVRRLGSCRVEIEGKPLDCTFLEPPAPDQAATDRPAGATVIVELPDDPAVAAGKTVRLAKARYDGVFVLPASALVPTTGDDRRVFVVRDGRAESYAVVLADQSPTEIVVSQGLEPGSAVVVDVPKELRPRSRVRVREP